MYILVLLVYWLGFDKKLCTQSLHSKSNNYYVRKTTKIIKKMMTTMNILTMSHRLEVMPLKYLSSSVCAASTFVRASSTLSSILQTTRDSGGREGNKGNNLGQL